LEGAKGFQIEPREQLKRLAVAGEGTLGGDGLEEDQIFLTAKDCFKGGCK
jgi:hypothetical protein